MIVYPRVRTVAAADRKRLMKLEERRNRSLYREPAPERVPPTITLPPVSTREITDADIGLPHDPVAQLKAETYLRAAIGHRLREAAQATTVKPTAAATINVEIPDESLALSDHAVILAELRRIKAMPVPTWMRADRGRLAS
ncbi:hypothetical protein ACRAWG_21560 [Methylobacterium sp. P31]